MTQERIGQTTAAYVAAAQREGGPASIASKPRAAHGYLISQFHARRPPENRRTDEYRGSLENRARFGSIHPARREGRGAVSRRIYRLSVEDYF